MAAISAFRSRFFCHCERREQLVELFQHRNDKKELHSSRAADSVHKKQVVPKTQKLNKPFQKQIVTIKSLILNLKIN